MSSFKQMDEYFEKAFRLAYFINGSRQKAVSIVIAALGKLEVAATAQFKRLYYTPARRSAAQTPVKPETHRTKVSLSELHLLQRLIYIESETYEREREQSQDAGAPGEEALLVHFIKHLVRITLKRNSFYVTLGISRLLHNYSTAETMEIYNVAVQDPERVKDDYYYRSRKGRLIQEVKERFGDLLSICRGPRGEERFKTQDDPREYVGLVEECLNQFSPWDTECSVPLAFDPVTDELSPLSCSVQGEEDRVEINRIHAILHPRCYNSITKALKMDAPERRLDIPYFFLKNGDKDMNSPDRPSRHSASPLSIDELEAIKSTLGEQSARRKTTHTGTLSIIVDGAERARLDLKRSGKIKLVIEEGDELVEVRALDEGRETLLATHMIGGGETGDLLGPISSEIMLEGGQKISFLMSPIKERPGSLAQYELTIAYTETRWLAAATLFSRRAASRFADLYGSRNGRRRAFVRPALVGLALIFFTGALVLLINSRRPRTSPGQVAQVKHPVTIGRLRVPASPLPPEVKSLAHSNSNPEKAAASPETSETEAANRETKTASGRTELRNSLGLPVQTPRRAPVQPSAKTSTELRAGRDPGGSGDPETVAEVRPTGRDATRTVESVAAPVTLNRVRKIYLEISGDARLGQQVRQLLARKLQESGRFIVTEEKDVADAAFKLFVEEKPPGRAGSRKAENRAEVNAGANGNVSTEALSATISTRLVNEDGEVIWPTKKSKSRGRYSGRLSETTARIVRDILEEIRSSEAQE